MRIATSADVPAVRSLLARSYAGDPLVQWVFPDASTREAASAAWLGLFVEEPCTAGAVDIIDGSDGPLAVACGAPAPRAQQWPPSPVRGRCSRRWSGAPTPARWARAWPWLAPLAPTEPSHHLQFLAVAPGQQRQGLGRSVIAPGLARAGGDGVGVHLETTNPDAAAFYDALGFVRSGSVVLGPDGPQLWALRRPPRRRPAPPG